uniref:Uncharacterized protein n=1 Tax=Anopheles atroparvus TaxID=41427 RepID=A0A182JEK4_ANOAO
MVLKRFETCLLVLCWIVLIGSGYCDSQLNVSPNSQEGSLVNYPKPHQLQFDGGAFRVTADVILRLNELIKSLAMFSLDGALDTRTALNMTEDEWNRTERILIGLVQSESASSNPTLAKTLHDSLNAIRREKVKFILLGKFLVNRTNGEIDRSSSVLHAFQDTTPTGEPPLSLILHPSIVGLTQVSAVLLRSMDTNGSKQNAQPRAASATAPSIEEFLTGFAGKFRETRRILTVEAKRYLSRTKARLSVVPASEKVSLYESGIAHTIAMFIKSVTHILGFASKSINHEMIENGAVLVDQQLSDGLGQLLKKATNVGHYAFLELCLKRYVYRYYDQSQALAKLLYCVQPETDTLEYLVTVFGTILARAAITDSSAVQMTVICSMGSSDCMNTFYDSLEQQHSAVQLRFDGYVDFIQQEIDAMVQRVTVCAQSTVFEIEAFATKTKTNFKQCLSSGKIN